ncbi:hypothetical protein ACFQT0_31155 [Hymenobacter humi]|uniref:Calx-beta domain-containing protein n=1 Tax=Hymenobacter humi TaxID=1411620 RepID=A0ABW2UD85_9BACT
MAPTSLRVVARSTSGVEGVQRISFVVRNGPAITVLGLSENDTVSDVVPLTVSAYGSERADSFVITASETPQGVPAWVWAGILAFMGWGRTTYSPPFPCPPASVGILYLLFRPWKLPKKPTSASRTISAG